MRQRGGSCFSQQSLRRVKDRDKACHLRAIVMQVATARTMLPDKLSRQQPEKLLAHKLLNNRIHACKCVMQIAA
ncbi:MAG: hypothetical protein Q8K74_10895 [Candidatus Nitrotoga sp.]|nr:hypothetical protein [Candidatus Nitrotoga sp.]MDP1856526.1 hypothetical protein [Candidatus Nitrotoga sp.]